MAGRLYVDANVFIAMLERSDDMAALLLRLFSTRGPSGRPHFVTSELSVAETLVIPLRNADEPLIAAYEDWVGGNEAVEAHRIDRRILASAASLRAATSAIRLPDAIHLATAIECDCTLFLTSDKKLLGLAPRALRDSVPGIPESLGFAAPNVPMLEQLIVEVAS